MDTRDLAGLPPANPQFTHVPPRYLQPRAHSAPRERPPAVPVLSAAHATVFRAVQPRYLDSRAATPQRPPPAPPQWLTDHRARKGSVPARYMEPTLRQRAAEQCLTPREEVDARRSSASRELGWRGGAAATHQTFDELRRRNRALVSDRPTAAGRKAAQTPSVVAEYIRHGTPIDERTTPRHSPRRRHFEKPGMAAGCAPPRRSRSPMMQREDARVESLRHRLLESKAPRGSVPRVARLAPAYSIPEGEWPRSDSPAPMLDSPPAAEGTLLGPMTLSVPPGAVVRLR